MSGSMPEWEDNRPWRTARLRSRRRPTPTTTPDTSMRKLTATSCDSAITACSRSCGWYSRASKSCSAFLLTVPFAAMLHRTRRCGPPCVRDRTHELDALSVVFLLGPTFLHRFGER